MTLHAEVVVIGAGMSGSAAPCAPTAQSPARTDLPCYAKPPFGLC